MNSVQSSGSTRVGTTPFSRFNSSDLLRSELSFDGSPPSIPSAICFSRRRKLLRIVRLMSTSRSLALCRSAGLYYLSGRDLSLAFLSKLCPQPGRNRDGLGLQSSIQGVKGARLSRRECICRDASVVAFFNAVIMAGSVL